MSVSTGYLKDEGYVGQCRMADHPGQTAMTYLTFAWVRVAVASRSEGRRRIVQMDQPNQTQHVALSHLREESLESMEFMESVAGGE